MSSVLLPSPRPDHATGPRGRFRQDWWDADAERGPGGAWTLRQVLQPDTGGHGTIDLALTLDGSGPTPAPRPGAARAELGGSTDSVLELPAPDREGVPPLPASVVQTLTWSFSDRAGSPVTPSTLGLTLHGLGTAGAERIVLSGATMTSVLLCQAPRVEVGINTLHARPARGAGADAHVRLTLAVFAGGALSLRRELLGSPGPTGAPAAAGSFAVGDLVLQR